MTKIKFEYIRLDGYTPEANLRGKTNIIEMEQFNGNHESLPDRGFDGSSTLQAKGHASDCVLRPVKAVLDITRDNAWLVMCEVLNADGKPNHTNTRATIKHDTKDMWFGYEQEYVLVQNGKPLGFPEKGYPSPQGKYYCGVGYSQMGDIARMIVEEHLDICLAAGLPITCVNAEVLKGQREYGTFSKGGKNAGDDLWLSRYIMMRLCEKYGVDLLLHPKPVKGDWNGTGMHCNFSNKKMREKGGEKYFTKICKQFGKHVQSHISVYGSDNDQRLTGDHETQSIDQFSFGVSDRGASIRIPLATVQNSWKGRLEDRRVAANADPYQVAARVMKTLSEVK